MIAAMIQIARYGAQTFSEGAPHGSDTVVNLADGPALLLYLVLIFLVGMIMIWNARSYQAPHLAHSAHEEHATHGMQGEALEERMPAVHVEVDAPTRDDLKIIEGIGPKTEAVFNAAGIFNFLQLSKTPVQKLDEILDAAGLRLGDPGSWPEQARLAAEGDWEGLKQFQDRLKGGRVV